MHVLIIPSWYGRNANDVKGSFFREQALALQKHGCQVGVLHVELNPLYNYRDIIFFPFSTVEIDEQIPTYRYIWSSWFPMMIGIQQAICKYFAHRLFKRYIQKHGMPDIIQAYSIFNGGVIANFLRETYHIPFVITEHSSGFYRNQYANRLNQASLIAQQAAHCFCVSSSFATLLNDRLIDSPKWGVHHNMVSDSFLNAKLNTNREHPFCFITISNLIDIKNTALIIQSFARAFKGDDDVVLKIVGDGALKKKLQQLTRQLDVEHQIFFHGTLNRREVIRVLQSAHVMVLGSTYETFGVVLIEALAMGLPVISTACQGPQDIITEKVGILTKLNDVNDMVKAMLYMREHLNDYDPHALREYCKDRFSSEVFARRIIDVYKATLEDAR